MSCRDAIIYQHANANFFLVQGVHIAYEDLYNSIVFFTAIYVAGVVSARVLKMPNLVGEIIAGIILGKLFIHLIVWRVIECSAHCGSSKINSLIDNT